jgi:hypothetical protein
MTSWARSRAPSFMSRRPTWVFAVDRLTCRWDAISALDRPSPTRVRTSRSRSVISSTAAAGRCLGSGRLVNSSMSRRVTAGARSASPAATTRIAVSRSAGRVSLSRKPLAPARSAAKTYSSRSKVVRISTRTAEVCGSAVICRVASMPSVPGIRMSIRTMSGFSRRAISTASAPVAASPTEARSDAVSTRTRKLPRTRAWSSATSTRIVMPRCPQALCSRAGTGR